MAFHGGIEGDPLDREDDRFFVATRRFAADGTPLGKTVAVSPVTEVSAFNIRVGKDGEGNFLVTWTGQFGRLGSGTFARRFASDGTAMTRTIRLPMFATALSVGMRGNFLLAWREFGVPGPTDTEIRVRRFAADGSPLGPVVRADADARGDRFLSSSAIVAGGGFVVVWESSERDPEAFFFDVFARRFRRH